MTILETKEEIAAAVGTVAGVTAYANKPPVLRPGDAFVRWRGWARADGQAFLATYSVIFVLPQDGEESADGWVYDHADAIAEALRPTMFVESMEPTLLPAEGAPRGLFSLTVTGRTE